MLKRNCLLALSLCISTAVSQAGILILSVNLNGPSESPPNVSPGTGTATVTIDDVLNTLHVQLAFSGLTSGTTASHIHCCTAQAGLGTAGVATTTPTFLNFPLGVTSGTYDNTLDLTLASSYNPAFVTANGNTTAGAEAALIAGIEAGEAYLNIHTTTSPTGEIRGFLVPEPGTVFLMSLGLGGLILAARKKFVHS